MRACLVSSTFAAVVVLWRAASPEQDRSLPAEAASPWSSSVSWSGRAEVRVDAPLQEEWSDLRRCLRHLLHLRRSFGEGFRALCCLAEEAPRDAVLPLEVEVEALTLVEGEKEDAGNGTMIIHVRLSRYASESSRYQL